jgi:tetratricopeptide (TPR) repeat protein
MDDLRSEKEMKQLAQQVLKWLAMDGNSRWLLIFDNIDQYSSSHHDGIDGAYDIKEFFPPANHGSIIITTRLQKLTELGSPYPVQKLPANEAIQLLMKCSHYTAESHEGHITDTGIKQLARRLDGFPLVIVLAGSFIHRTGMSFTKYLQYYRQSWHHLQSAAKPQREYANGNMLTTWVISYQEIIKQNPSAAKLLLLLSCFHNQDIWYELVARGMDANPPEWFTAVVSSEIQFSTTIQHLIDFSLVQSSFRKSSYSLHPAIQDWSQHELHKIDLNLKEADSRSQVIVYIVVIAIGYTVLQSLEKEYWVLQQRLLPHVDHMPNMLVLIGSRLLDNAVMDSIDAFGLLYWRQGKLNEAEEIFQRALASKEKALGTDDPSTLVTVHNLGMIYRAQGKLNEAEEMYLRALAGNVKALGADHTSTLSTVLNLGLLYQNQGRLNATKEMYQRALAGLEKVLGHDHTFTLMILHCRANIYREQGKLEEAAAAYLEVITGLEERLGPENSSNLDAVEYLGTLHLRQREFHNAERLYNRALSGFEADLGSHHPVALQTVLHKGNLAEKQGKLLEADVLYSRALARFKQKLGPDHLSTPQALFDSGNFLEQQGKQEEAREIYQQVLTRREKVLGSHRPDTMKAAEKVNFLTAKRDYIHFGDATVSLRHSDIYKTTIGVSCLYVLLFSFSRMAGFDTHIQFSFHFSLIPLFVVSLLSLRLMYNNHH